MKGVEGPRGAYRLTYMLIIDYSVEVNNQALEGAISKEWVDYVIVPIHKKGPVSDPNNCCEIALLSTGARYLVGCLQGA